MSRNPNMRAAPQAGGLPWPRINPEDRIDRSNIGEHNRIIDSLNANIDLTDRAYEMADQAVELANDANGTAQLALITAEQADGKADRAIADAAQVASDLAAFESEVPRLIDDATDDLLIPILPSPFEQTAGVVRFTEKTKGGTINVSEVPIRTRSAAGLMTDEDALLLEDLDTRVQILEQTGAAGGLYRLAGSTFAGMSDADRDAAVAAVKGTAAINGDTAVDDAPSFWIRASSSGGGFTWTTIPQIAVPNPGGGQLIISSTTDGKVTIESDGTASVAGWGPLNTLISGMNLNLNQTIIKTGDLENEQNRQQIELSQLSGLLSGKIDKAQGTQNANLFMATDDQGNFTLKNIKNTGQVVFYLHNNGSGLQQIDVSPFASLNRTFRLFIDNRTHGWAGEQEADGFHMSVSMFDSSQDPGPGQSVPVTGLVTGYYDQYTYSSTSEGNRRLSAAGYIAAGMPEMHVPLVEFPCLSTKRVAFDMTFHIPIALYAVCFHVFGDLYRGSISDNDGFAIVEVYTREFQP